MATISKIFETLNGTHSVGLSELADKGLPKAKWYVVPVAAFKKAKVTLAGASEEAKGFSELVENEGIRKDMLLGDRRAADKLSLTTCNGKLVANAKSAYNYTVTPFEDIDRKLIINTILAQFMDEAEEVRAFKQACNLIALNYGFISVTKHDEAYVVQNVTVDVSESSLKTFAAYIEDNLNVILTSFVCAAVQHWSSNHMLAGGIGSGLWGKVITLGGLDKLLNCKGASLAAAIYSAIHPISKRNVLASITKAIPNLHKVVTIGLKLPEDLLADNSMLLRISALPAGNKRIDIAVILMKYAAANGYLSVSSAAARFKDIAELRKKALNAGVGAHVGASYYTAKNPTVLRYVEYSSSVVNEAIRDYGSVVTALNEGSTLAKSPIVIATIAGIPNATAIARAKAIFAEREKLIASQKEGIAQEETKEVAKVKEFVYSDAVKNIEETRLDFGVTEAAAVDEISTLTADKGGE